MGYVAVTTHTRPNNYSVSHKRLEYVPSNSSNHRSRALSIEFYPTLASSLTFRTTVLSSLCRIGQPYSHCVDCNSKKSTTAACLSTTDLAFNCSTHNIYPLICNAHLHYIIAASFIAFKRCCN